MTAPRQQKTVTVEQYKAYDKPLTYIVRQTVNTITPHIGKELTETDVRVLIAQGTKVTIKGSS